MKEMNIANILVEKLYEDDLIEMYNDLQEWLKSDEKICTINDYLEEHGDDEDSWDKLEEYVDEDLRNCMAYTDLLFVSYTGKIIYEPNVFKMFVNSVCNEDLIAFLKESIEKDPYDLEKQCNEVYEYISRKEEN